MPTAAKGAIIDELSGMLESAEGVVLASYTKLSVPQFNRLRRELATGGVQMKVVKNTLLKRAADAAGVSGLEPYLNGPTLMAASTDDPVSAARLVQSAAREFRTLEIKAGILGRQAISADAARSLALLPGRSELLAQVAGAMAAPIQQVAAVFNAPLASLARVVDQVRQQKESA